VPAGSADRTDRSAGGGDLAESPRLDLELELVELDVLPVAIDHEGLRSIVPFVLEQEAQGGAWTVTVALTDDRRLRELHRQFMGIDEDTDVMTFPAGPEDPAAGGEIVVSVERAACQGPDHGLDPAAEVEFLVVHGLLHLCGWDDTTPGDRERMLGRQRELLAAFGGSRLRPD
jgi:rRNA maturation RNase YbeY